MKKDLLKLQKMIFRYLFLLILGIAGFFYFYKILTPLTVYPSYFLIKLFYDVSLQEAIISIGNYQIEIISACIAVGAYYLLLILNLTTPMNLKQRIYSLVYSIVLLLILNILRIFILSILFINNYIYFDIIHKTFWHLLSTTFVILIWFSTVKIFNIKQIPVYSDFRFLKKQTNLQ